MKKLLLFLLLTVTVYSATMRAIDYTLINGCQNGGVPVFSHTGTTKINSYNGYASPYDCTISSDGQWCAYQQYGPYVEASTWKTTLYFNVFTCVVGDPCTNGEQYDSSTGTCHPPCPSNSSWDSVQEKCNCNTDYYATYDISGNMTCELPECPTSYDSHNPPLPLFKIVTDPSFCNFFAMADGAYLQINSSRTCCYGQESIDDNNTCGTNEMEINGQCYPLVENNDTNPPIECNGDEYYSESQGGCVPIFTTDTNGSTSPNDGVNSDTVDGDINTPLTDTNGDGKTNVDDYSGDGSEFGIDLDAVKGKLTSVINSYVLVDVPITASGTCSSDLQRTFTILGQSYTLDLAPYMQQFNEYLPIIKSLVLFMFAFSAVVLVLASSRN